MATTTVLSILSLTTRPLRDFLVCLSRHRLRSVPCLLAHRWRSARSVSRSSVRSARFLLAAPVRAEDCPAACVASCCDLVQVLVAPPSDLLPARQLRSSCGTPSDCLIPLHAALLFLRTRTWSAIGSLWPPAAWLPWPAPPSTPAISKSIRPGFTTATQPSGAPLPLPMRVSAGFLVNGLSGKIADPDLAAALDVPGHGNSGGLDLVAVIQPPPAPAAPNSPKSISVALGACRALSRAAACDA